MNIFVTGGAGFIGSHIIDRLLNDGHTVVCIDDLSSGSLENINDHFPNSNFTFIELDILDIGHLRSIFSTNKCDCVFHLAANSDIQKGISDPYRDYELTFRATFNVLLCMHEFQVGEIVFSSSSTIYGEIDSQLHEDTGPLLPISFYGSAKLSSEAYISSFSHKCNFKAWIFRFPNVVGRRLTHGVIFDFLRKLEDNQQQLFILGNGQQEKSYLYIDELVEGIMFGWEHSKDRINYFNIGGTDSITVQKIAEIIIEILDHANVNITYSGGKRGWIGDVPKYQYNLSKIHALGWHSKMDSEEAVRIAIQEMVGSPK